MFSFHKPRVYRSTEGCCICRAKSSSSRFTDSKKYEDDSVKCFNLEEPRQGEICNACVLLVKRYKRLPAESNRHWGHVVDARVGPGMKSMTKFKKLKEDLAQQQNRSTIPEKFSKIFKKTKKPNKDQVKRSWDQSLPPTPDSLDSDGEGAKSNGRSSQPRVNRRKLKYPKKLVNRFDDDTSFIDEKVWRAIRSCCGVVFENIELNAIIIDAQTFRLCAEHKKEAKIKVEQMMSVDGSNLMVQPVSKQTTLPVLKKHHLFFKRQAEDFPCGDLLPKPESNSANKIKTEISPIAISTNGNHSQKNDGIKQLMHLTTTADLPAKQNSSKSNSFLHKIKSDTGKIMKHSLEKINAIRIKNAADMNEMKNLVKTVDRAFITKAIDENKNAIGGKTAAQSVATKFNDNSSDSGFDEDRKSASPMQDDQDKKLGTRPAQTLFLSSGVQIQGQQQNLVLTGNEVAAKILQSRRHPQSTKNFNTSSKAGQITTTTPILSATSGSQKSRAIYKSNQSTENSVSLMQKSAQTTSKVCTIQSSSATLNLTSASVASLNQKIVLVKTKYNHHNQQQPTPTTN